MVGNNLSLLDTGALEHRCVFYKTSQRNRNTDQLLRGYIQHSIYFDRAADLSILNFAKHYAYCFALRFRELYKIFIFVLIGGYVRRFFRNLFVTARDNASSQKQKNQNIK